MCEDAGNEGVCKCEHEAVGDKRDGERHRQSGVTRGDEAKHDHHGDEDDVGSRNR